MLPFTETHLRFAATFGLTKRKIPPSVLCRRSPVASKIIALESACGDVPPAIEPPALAPLQSTLCQGFPGSRDASPRKVLPLKLVQPLIFGNGESCRSPEMKTTLGSIGSATIAPCTSPCSPG